MPELPDIEVYREALRDRVCGRPIRRIRIISPFLLRSVDPPIDMVESKVVVDICRQGKRIVFCLDADLFLVLHLMISGRLRWLDIDRKPPGRITLAVLEFENGSLAITEAGTKKRASLVLLRGPEALGAGDPGGMEPLSADLAEFAEALRQENRTLKRALTDPRLFAGIGNAYSDEILHAAGLSPVARTKTLSDDAVRRLHEATRQVLGDWTLRLRRQFAGRFPGVGEITAFREGFAAHGRFGKPCPRCGVKIQRIRYAENETNYCPGCQTEGRILADRSLSRLLRDDWPRSVEELG